jgi:hypothetical protein
MMKYPFDQTQGFTIFLNDPDRQVLGIMGHTKPIVTSTENKQFGGFQTFAILPYDKIKGLNKETIRKIKYHKRKMRDYKELKNADQYLLHHDKLREIYVQVIASHPKIKGHKRNE